jgi:diadenosine tetraphosphate (Ap4A) HIT family hydrolase
MIDFPLVGKEGGAACPFCNYGATVHENEHAFSCWDTAPASPGHLLVLPKRHIPDFFAIWPEELTDIWALLQLGQALIVRQHLPDGFNLGVNLGIAAGQTVSHAHLHVIPRYRGDVEDPRGGVRAVIPSHRGEATSVPSIMSPSEGQW